MPRDHLVSDAEFSREAKISRRQVARLRGKLPTGRGGKLWLRRGLQALDELRQAREDKPVTPMETQEARALLLDAKARKEVALAEARELDVARRRDELLPLVEVQADARRAAEAIRIALRSLPSRCAARAESLTAPQIEALIADEINDVLAVLNGTRFASSEPAP